MTPLLQKCLDRALQDNNKFPVERFKWFDISEITLSAGNFAKVDPEVIKSPLPFESVGLVAKDDKNNEAMIILSNKHVLTEHSEGTLIQCWVHFADGDFTIALPPCVYATDEDVTDGIPLAMFDPETKRQLNRDEIRDDRFECITTSLYYVELFLLSLESKSLSYHEPIRRSNHEKRIRQKKAPLFDWKTVTIQPTKPKREHLGGTHASPRLHDRRGHWRVMKKSQKRVWVRDCKVGNASNGVVFHDYKVINPQQENSNADNT